MGEFFKTMLVVGITMYQEAKQNSMKKAKYLNLTWWKEFILKSGKTENQELPGNLPNIGKLFVRDPI